MIAPALLCRPSARWQIWLAFGCAAALYLAAIALARTEFQAPLVPPPTDSGVDVVIDPTPDQTPVQPVEPTRPSHPNSLNQTKHFQRKILLRHRFARRCGSQYLT